MDTQSVLPARQPWSRLRAWWIEAGLSVLGVAVFTAAVAAILLLGNRHFFAVDDAVNEFAPYSHQIHRLIHSGQIPILTAQSVSGGNLLIDFGRAPLNPISILIALAVGGSQDVALITATFGITAMFLMTLGGYALGRIIGLRAAYAALAAASLGVAPMFLYVYAADWWNGAVGMIGFVWATATLLWALERPTVPRLLALAASVYVALTSGWPHTYAAVAISALVAGIAHLCHSERPWKDRLIRVGTVAAVTGLAAIMSYPQLSEYLRNSKYLFRTASFENWMNFGVPSLGQTVMPWITSGDYWSTFGGFVYWSLPIGFVSLLTLLAVWFVDWPRAYQSSGRVKTMVHFAVVLVVLSQLPSQVGPLRWPFRVLPFLAVVVMVLALFGLQEYFAWSRRRAGGMAVTIASSMTVVALRAPDVTDDVFQFIVMPLIVIAALAIAGFLLRSAPRRLVVFAALAVFGSYVVISLNPPLGDQKLMFRGVAQPDRAHAPLPDSDEQGFVLHVYGTAGLRNDVWPGMISGRYLLYGIPLFNGYDPVGVTSYHSTFPSPTAQGGLPASVLDGLSQPGKPALTGTCRFDTYRIGWVVTPSDPVEGRHAALKRCGFTEWGRRGATAIFHHELPRQTSYASVTTRGIELDATLPQSNDKTDVLKVTNNSDESGRVAYARMWWPGYTASLDGRPLQVRRLGSTLLTVVVPPHAKGTLTLRYWPTTWGTALPMAAGAAVGVLGMTIAVGIVNWRRRHDSAV